MTRRDFVPGNKPVNKGDGHRDRLGQRGRVAHAAICDLCGRAGFHAPACAARGTGA